VFVVGGGQGGSVFYTKWLIPLGVQKGDGGRFYLWIFGYVSSSEGAIVFSSVRLCVCLLVYLSVCQHDSLNPEPLEVSSNFQGIVDC